MNEYAFEMTTTEVKDLSVHVTNLQEGETFEAVVTHIPPSGDPIDVEHDIDGEYINLLFGPVGVVGQHYLKVQADKSLGAKPETLFTILVKI